MIEKSMNKENEFHQLFRFVCDNSVPLFNDSFNNPSHFNDNLAQLEQLITIYNKAMKHLAKVFNSKPVLLNSFKLYLKKSKTIE